MISTSHKAILQQSEANDRPYCSYVLVTPARNEAQFIELTIQSVVRQRQRPVKWVIVSDGSTDGTDEIVARYASTFDWIELVRQPEREERNFAGKAAAFSAGYARLSDVEYDVVGNLDADLSFDEDYCAFLMAKFAENPRLGVAGTPYRETSTEPDNRLQSRDHVSGACQLFRRQCFEEIGGYPRIRSGGIDLIALLSAQAKGWETKRFDEKTSFHHRSVGSGETAGLWRRLMKRGRKDYLHGSHPGFEFFRCLYQMRQKPLFIGGFLMLAGYFLALLTGVERTMPYDLVVIRRADQIRRLKRVLLHPLRSGV